MVFGAFNTFQTDSSYDSAIPSNKATVTISPSVIPTTYLEPSNNKYYWVYSFTNTSTPYTMTFSNVSSSVPLSILAVGGGGAGGIPRGYSGGGGAGGMIEQSKFITSSQSLTINIGAGGDTTNGFATTISQLAINAIGGGCGGIYSTNNGNGNSGGSGGGGSGGLSIQTSGGLGTLNQGNSGGNGAVSGLVIGAGGGGGGAGVNGYNALTNQGGDGGDGKIPSLKGIPNKDANGNAIYYAGGGGGMSTGVSSGKGGKGGKGGGGDGGSYGPGLNGTPNTGGGGGGDDEVGPSGNGGSGIVIIAIPQENII